MSSSLTQINTMSASAFLDTLGVNMHIFGSGAQYSDATVDLNELTYLDVHNVRDYYDPAQESVYASLGQNGIKFDILTNYGGPNTISDIQAKLSSLDQLNAAAPGVVAAVEGPNEINNWPVTYNGQTGFNSAVAYQQDLYSLAHADSNLPGVKVYYFTGYGLSGAGTNGQTNPQGPNPATTPGLADYDTAHPYPDISLPPLEGVMNTSWALNPLRSNALSNENPATGPAVYTETGYSDGPNADGPHWKAVGDLELLLDDAQQGIAKTYLYELQDEGPSSGSSVGLGLFTSGQPNPAAIAIHNLTTLLASSGSSPPTTSGIGYSVTGLPSSTGHAMEFVGGDGASYIAIWNENWQQGQPTPSTNVTVKLNAAASIAIYDPIQSSTAIQNLANASNVALTLTEDPVILKVSPSSPPPKPSPDGTTIHSASDPAIIDQAGNAWTLVQSASSGLQIAVNGVVDAPTSNVVMLETLHGTMVQENSAANWYSETTPNDSWMQIPNPNPNPKPSPDGTTIHSASDPAIIDQAGNAWLLVQSASSGLQIAVNGVVDAPTSNVVLLETLHGAMVQENSAGNWYSETTPNDSWIQVLNTNPAPPAIVTGTGSDTLVLSISEDAYANGDGTSDAKGDAAFTVSVDGKQLAGTFYATALHSAGASQTFTFKGDWAPGAHTVAVAFLNGAYAGTPSTDRNLYVNDITYDGTDTKQSAALMSTGSHSFTVTDSTAIPSPAIGSGSDTLVLKVSEDAYKGNAQFTVSVDGKQLGGTLTATTLHSSGASQSFTFDGDFGSGQHTVSVKFLNDLYAGTPSTDRNLYVNDIVYNGTDTGLSAPLMSTGAKTFTVSGGTTPSVSETGDHGSLQENLSQTGTYTVGGDTFVLASGNAASVTLGTGVSQIKFIGPTSVTLTGGAGQATVTADMGTNKFVAGAGSLDVTGGAGKDAYVFHATSGLLTLEDFSLAKGDTLTIDKALQGSLHQVCDGAGGTMLTFGANASIDLKAIAAVPTIHWA